MSNQTELNDSERADGKSRLNVGLGRTYTLIFYDERDFCNAVSPLVGAAYVNGDMAAKAINNCDFRQDHSFGKVKAEIMPNDKLRCE